MEHLVKFKNQLLICKTKEQFLVACMLSVMEHLEATDNDLNLPTLAHISKMAVDYFGETKFESKDLLEHHIAIAEKKINPNLN